MFMRLWASMPTKIAWGGFFLLVGASLVCGAATLQLTLVLGVALTPRSYVIPVCVGGISGLTIGSLFLSLKRRVRELEIESGQSRQVREDLREREEYWRSLTEHSPDHMMLLDRELRIQSINHTVPDLKKEDVIGKSVLDFVPPKYHRDVGDSIRSVFETAEWGRFETEYYPPTEQSTFLRLPRGRYFETESRWR